MPFDKQPTLVGKCVGVRPLVASDYDALYSVASDPLIWEQHPTPDRFKAEVFGKFFKEALESGGALLVTDLETGEVIGSSRFHGYSEERSEVEIGWTFLTRNRWGGRYNGDLKAIMTTHAFKSVKSVLLIINPKNMRSRRAAEKIGAIVDPKFDSDGRMIYRLRRAA